MLNPVEISRTGLFGFLTYSLFIKFVLAATPHVTQVSQQPRDVNVAAVVPSTLGQIGVNPVSGLPAPSEMF